MAGFHEGELAVQRRAGVLEEAARLAGMVEPGELGSGAARFLQERTFAVLAARDADGWLWTSALTGPRGFLTGAGTSLHIRAVPASGDSLAGLQPGQPAGLLVIDLATRRRLRINGQLTAAGQDHLDIEVEQAYGNCPQYIQRRQLIPRAGTAAGQDTLGRRTEALESGQAALIGRADTFFLGTTHPDRGNDCSHRGGPPGFVRADGNTLWWPDYPGNNMFNSLGNLEADDTAALLFIDFDSGETVQLSGCARAEWLSPGSPGDDGGTGRRVWFTGRAFASGELPRVRAARVEPYPHNPPVGPHSSAGLD
jgi:predicted pyridoxine 5'-phosphate oxidase superfamily flavin-nucleotide-binding protein